MSATIRKIQWDDHSESSLPRNDSCTGREEEAKEEAIAAETSWHQNCGVRFLVLSLAEMVDAFSNIAGSLFKKEEFQLAGFQRDR